MAREFKLSVVAPDRAVVEQDVTATTLPGELGYFGVFAGHVPLIVALSPGILEYLGANNERHFVYVGGGFAEIQPDRVTVVADEAQPARDIDLARAEEVLENARRALRGEESTISKEQAVMEVEKAMSRVRAARTSR